MKPVNTRNGGAESTPTRIRIRLARVLSSLVVLGLLGGLIAACTSTDRMADASRSYTSGYDEAVRVVGDVVQSMGLSLEHAGPENDSSYVLNAVRIKQVFGFSEPVRVATLRIYVSAVETRAVRVRADQEKVSRTSMAGNDTIRRDYREQFFRRLDDRLERTTESSP
jgi:hypothetical protein